jgi:hypothetical protein
MFVWPSFWIRTNLPWSGDVVQNIEPNTNVDLPFSDDYAGDRKTERQIITNVAGYGMQLGIVIDALDELIAATGSEQRPACARLRALREEIATLKRAHYEKILPNALAYFARSDRTGFERMVEEARSKAT